MATVQAKLIEIARSIRPGSAERLIVLRATEQGMANLLNASARGQVASPKPTVLPAKLPDTPGGMHIIRQPDGGPAPAALPAMIATEAYVESGAAPSPTARDGNDRNDAVGNEAMRRADQLLQPHGLDVRVQSSLAHAQLPAALATAAAEDEAARARARNGGGREDGDVAPVERIAVLAIGAGAILLTAIILIWSILP